MNDKIQLKRGTLANWLKADPILMDGELALVATDASKPTVYDSQKVGDGIHKFSELEMLGYKCLQEFGASQQFPISQKAITDWINNGYQFRGIATPDTNPGTPDGPVFYFAAEAGTYSNFSGITINTDETAILIWNNGATWEKEVTSKAVTTEKIADGAVTPSKLVMKVLHELGESEIDTLSQKTISAYIRKINPNNLGIFPELYPESFYITDKFGNVLLKITKTETSFINIKESGFIMQDDICQETGNSTQYPMSQNSVTEAINSVLNKIIGIWANANSSELIVSDESGNIALRVNSTGVDYIGKITEEKVENQIENAKLSKLKGKNIFTLGDSLCTSGKWQNKLAELSGANFDNSMNTDKIHPISYGGTSTSGTAKFNGGFQRAKNLVEYWVKEMGVSVDILFIENINDMNKAYGYAKTLDSINIDPFFENQSIRLSNVFDSSTAFFSYAKEHLNTIALSPAVGTVIYGSYKDNEKQSSRVTVGSSATQDGVIKLKVGNNTYNINVPAGASKEEIAAKIEEVDYVGYYDILNDDGTIDFDIVIEIADNTTGCELSLTTLDYSRKFVSMLFKSKNINDFYNPEMWDTNNYFYLTLYRMYKGLLSYLTKNLPNTKIYWLFPTRYGINLSNPPEKYTYEDGSFNYSAYMKSPEPWVNGGTQDDGGPGGQVSALYDMQKEVCELFGVDYIDLHRKAGITLDNASEYYYDSNVHPKDKGYIKWAEEIFRQIG